MIFGSKQRVFPFLNFPYLWYFDSFSTRYTLFGSIRDIQFLNFLFLGCVAIALHLLRLFIHVQNVANITVSYWGFVLCAIGFVWFFVFGGG